MSGLDPLNIKGHWELFGSSIAEWILFIAGIVMLFMHYWFGFLFMVFWIENFGFYIIPKLFAKDKNTNESEGDKDGKD